jgi:succinyl-CoA synthetase beta subunit
VSPEAFPAVVSMLRERIGSVPCAGFLCEPALDVCNEWFASVDIDRAAGEWRAAVSVVGGGGVIGADTFFVRHLDSQRLPAPVADVIRRLASLVERNDAVHAEINPLAELRDGGFIALDAKIELDDAAAFRHPEWSAMNVLPPMGRAFTEREAAYNDFLKRAGHRGTFGRYLELDGDIALILSGGGASLLALDALRLAGGRAANYLEVSGNPDPDMLCEAAKIALSKTDVKGLWIAGSFANFTDIRATCGAILRAMNELDLRIPVVIRREGPNADAAEMESTSWSSANGIPLIFHRADMSLEASARELLSRLKV